MRITINKLQSKGGGVRCCGRALKRRRSGLHGFTEFPVNAVKFISARANLRSGVLFSEERESIATRESMRCREGGYDRRLGESRTE